MQFLKADTAATILIGPFLDKGDGVTPETGITLGAADAAELMKHDGTTFVDLTSDGRTFTHKQGGMYTLALGTGDTDTEGRLTVFIADDDVCLPVWKDFMVVNANVYDSLFAAAATDYLQVDAKQLDGSAIQQAGGYAKVKDDEGNTLANEAKQDTIDTVVDGIQTDLDNATDGLGALKALIDTLDTVADAIKAITDNLPDSGALDDLAAILTDTGTTLPATLSTIAGYIDAEVASILAAVDTEVAAIKAVTDLLPDAGALNDLAAILTDTGTTLDTKINTLDTNVDTLIARLTAARAGYLDELAAANIPADVDTLKTYCDILDHATNGLANIKSLVDTLDTVADAIKAKTDNQPAGIPKGVEFTLVFFMKLSSDHLTPATGKTVTTQISKDGGAFAGTDNSASEIAGGFYKVVLTATEMNAAIIGFKATETDCDQTSATITTSA